MVSGKDEEPIRDIPICVECGARPEFWILEFDRPSHEIGGWFWLHSNKVMKHDKCSRLEYVPPGEGPGFTLDEVTSITCRRDYGNNPSEEVFHSFCAGDPTFDKVLKQARRTSNER